MGTLADWGHEYGRVWHGAVVETRAALVAVASGSAVERFEVAVLAMGVVCLVIAAGWLINYLRRY